MNDQRIPWSERRLQKLYERYNKKYWNGRLPDYRIINGTVPPEHGDDLAGCCLAEDRTIILDILPYQSAHDIQGTLLHEMCHAAAYALGPKSRRHDSPFFEQTERLLRMGAPVNVCTSLYGRPLIPEMIPARFKRCRERIRDDEETEAEAASTYPWTAMRAKDAIELIADEFEHRACVRTKPRRRSNSGNGWSRSTAKVDFQIREIERVVPANPAADFKQTRNVH